MKLDFERHNISFVREKVDINEDDKLLLKNIRLRDPLAEISEQVIRNLLKKRSERILKQFCVILPGKRNVMETSTPLSQDARYSAKAA